MIRDLEKRLNEHADEWFDVVRQPFSFGWFGDVDERGRFTETDRLDGMKICVVVDYDHDLSRHMLLQIWDHNASDLGS